MLVVFNTVLSMYEINDILYTNCMIAVLWHYEHQISVISQQNQKLLNFSANTIKLHNSTTDNNFEAKNDFRHASSYNVHA